MLGKLNGLGLADMTAFASSETTQFLNTGFRVNPMLGLYAPYTAMTAAAVCMPTDWLKVTTGVNDNDPEGSGPSTHRLQYGVSWSRVAFGRSRVGIHDQAVQSDRPPTVWLVLDLT